MYQGSEIDRNEPTMGCHNNVLEKSLATLQIFFTVCVPSTLFIMRKIKGEAFDPVESVIECMCDGCVMGVCLCV